MDHKQFRVFLVSFVLFQNRLCILLKYTNGPEMALNEPQMVENGPQTVQGNFRTICVFSKPFVHFGPEIARNGPQTVENGPQTIQGNF